MPTTSESLEWSLRILQTWQCACSDTFPSRRCGTNNRIPPCRKRQVENEIIQRPNASDARIAHLQEGYNAKAYNATNSVLVRKMETIQNRFASPKAPVHKTKLGESASFSVLVSRENEACSRLPSGQHVHRAGRGHS